jgi:hypothetical protein
MNLEDFKNLADSIQSLMVALGVLIGGAWALFRFRTLKDIEKARAELEKARRDLHERGHLKLQMEASQFESTNNSILYINILLNITNIGNRTEIIRWLDSKIGAAPVIHTPDGIMQLGPELSAQNLGLYVNIVASTIDPGNSQQYCFLVPIESTGPYFIESLIMGSPEETRTAREKVKLAGVQTPGEVTGWGARMYFNVINKEAT